MLLGSIMNSDWIQPAHFHAQNIKNQYFVASNPFTNKVKCNCKTRRLVVTISTFSRDDMRQSVAPKGNNQSEPRQSQPHQVSSSESLARAGGALWKHWCSKHHQHWKRKWLQTTQRHQNKVAAEVTEPIWSWNQKRGVAFWGGRSSWFKTVFEFVASEAFSPFSL